MTRIYNICTTELFCEWQAREMAFAIAAYLLRNELPFRGMSSIKSIKLTPQMNVPDPKRSLSGNIDRLAKAISLQLASLIRIRGASVCGAAIKSQLPRAATCNR